MTNMDKLKEFKSKCTIIHHRQSGKTTENAAQALNVSKRQVIKSLLLKSSGDFFAAIIPGDRKLDIAKAKKHFGVSKISLASPEEVKQLTGFGIGGVPPYAFYRKCKVVIDTRLMDADYIIGSGGNEFTGLKFRSESLLILYNDKADVVQ